MAVRCRADVGRALGRVLAHELGHYLLSLREHSPAGLMQPLFRTNQLIARNRRSFELPQGYRPDAGTARGAGCAAGKRGHDAIAAVACRKDGHHGVRVPDGIPSGRRVARGARLSQRGRPVTPQPAVVVTGAWLTVKEQMPRTYALDLAEQGITAFTFDSQGSGRAGARRASSSCRRGRSPTSPPRPIFCRRCRS